MEINFFDMDNMLLRKKIVPVCLNFVQSARHLKSQLSN